MMMFEKSIKISILKCELCTCHFSIDGERVQEVKKRERVLRIIKNKTIKTEIIIICRNYSDN